MGKPRETFNKREKEKKRLQKRKEKEQRKEERKANAKEGSSLDEMMAYVDENGNITSTPPDPSKKKVIKAEDIVIGTPTFEHRPENLPRTGKVKFFNTSKGFGFIEDVESGESIFVHINNLSQPLSENDKVTFSTERGVKGLSAINVELIK
jgi:cold shock CspA family protein